MNRWLRGLFVFDDAGADTAPNAGNTDQSIAGDGQGETREVTPNAGEVPASTPSESFDPKTYVGSKEVNPDGRKLKNFDRSGFSSKEELDAFIREAGADLYLPDGEKKDEKPAKDVKKEEKTDNADKKTDEKAEEPTDGAEEELFLKKLKISREKFLELPESVQEALAGEHESGVEVTKEHEKLRETHTALISDIEKIKDDPIIAARLAELDSGKRFVARELPPISRKEVRQLLDVANDEDAFESAINELILTKSHDVINIERGVVERNRERAANEQKALSVLQEVFAMEPRLGVTEKDLSKIKEGHPEYDKFFGTGGIMEVLGRKKYTALQIATKGPKEILYELAMEKGWDKERDNNLVKKGAKTLLSNIRKATNGARTLSPERKTAPSNPTHGLGYDTDSLVAEIANGNLTNWSRLAQQFEHSGDAGKLAELNKIMDRGTRARKNK